MTLVDKTLPVLIAAKKCLNACVLRRKLSRFTANYEEYKSKTIAQDCKESWTWKWMDTKIEKLFKGSKIDVPFFPVDCAHIYMNN